jgi:ATP-dependent DNA ligase
VVTTTRATPQRPVSSLDGQPVARLADVFDDGHVLYDAVVEHGLEGIVAKRRTGIYGRAIAAGRR